ncbi:MAG: hypothetical protein V1745_01910 [Patescibacteria group bacterium]
MNPFRKMPSVMNDEERLRQMGSDRVLADLKKKYTQTEPTSYANESWQERTERLKREQASALEGAEARRATFSHEELSVIRKLWHRLEGTVAEFERGHSGLGVGTKTYVDAALKEVSGIVAHLDSLDIWSDRFTTMVGSGRPDELDRSDEDSIYYLTKSGLSIRVKRAALADGHPLKTVIQPVMEMLLFSRPGHRNEYSKEPVVGWSVRDYLSEAFKKRMGYDSLDDHASTLTTFEKEGKIVGVAGPEDTWIHDGDRVNAILKR